MELRLDLINGKVAAYAAAKCLDRPAATHVATADTFVAVSKTGS